MLAFPGCTTLHRPILSRRTACSLSMIAVAILFTQPSALAQTGGNSQVASDSLWTRPTLLEVPGGPKEKLRENGVSLDLWWTQFYQGPFSGSGNMAGQYGGKGDVILNIDARKMGLWDGFYINIHQETIYGRDANTIHDGTLFPVNTALAFPRLGGSDYDTSIYLTQAFGSAFSLSAGKFNMLDFAAKTPIQGGGGLDTFMNTALAAPISGVTPPYLLGAIATYKTAPAVFTLMVYDPRNAQDWKVIESPFADGVTTSLSVTLPVKIAGLPGYYGVRGVYSTKTGVDLSSVPQNLLPQATGTILQREGYKYGQISVQQYLYQDPSRPGIGWGFFGDASISDANPNPFAWRVTAGLGGNNLMRGRELDRWGVGYFKYQLSRDLLDGLNLLGLDRKSEQGVEAYYNLAITPWLRITADLQWIDPYEARKRNTWIGALRTQIRF